MNKIKQTGICFALAIFVVFTSYYFNKKSTSLKMLGLKPGKVTKIIDAQTIEINSTQTMSLNGIISPYMHEKFYQNAFDYLTNTLLNRNVDILISKTGWNSKYPLVYVILNEQNINAAMVEQGLAQTFYPAYQPERDMFYNNMKDAWTKCLKNNINFCNLSEFSNCLIIDQISIESRKEVVIKNACKQKINLKDWKFIGNGRIQNDIRKDLILEMDQETVIDMKNYIFDTVNEQFKKQITIIDKNKQLVFYHDFY